MTFEKLYPSARFAVIRIDGGRRQAVSLLRTETEARDVARRNNKICGTPGKRGIRYEAVHIKRNEKKEDEK